jgi:hypothetical protein
MDIPIDNVINLRRQGYSNNQIIEYLQRGGYSYTDIMDALTQSDIKGQIDPKQTMQQNIQQPDNPMQFQQSSVISSSSQSSGQQPSQPQQQQPSPSQQAPQQSAPPQQPQPEQTQQSAPQQSTGLSEAELEEKIQETAEAIIDERWDQLEDNIKKIIDWKNQMNVKFEKIEQQFTDLKTNFDKLHESVLGKVGDYDKHIQDVGTEVKALEKVFQKILPGFIENVNELSRVSKTFKETAEQNASSRTTKKTTKRKE